MKLNIEDVLIRRVLRCIVESEKTKEEIFAKYLQLYPPSVFAKILTPVRKEEQQVQIDRSITFLVKGGYVKTEITSFTNRALRIPRVTYSATPLGTHELMKGRKSGKS